MNLNAVTTIAGLEVRQRIRTSRWKWTLAILFVLISTIILGSLYLTAAFDGTYRAWSRFLLEIALGLVLFLGLSAAPTLSSTSINGDRRDATLALVQATPISSWDLALGKFLGAWAASLALLAVAVPYLIWGLATTPSGVLHGLIAIVTTAIVLGAYCAIGLAFSSITSRPAASAMLTQAVVLVLLIGLPVVFGLSFPLVAEKRTMQVAESYYPNGDSVAQCRIVERTTEISRTDRSWWLLIPNPVLIVSDALASGVDGSRGGETFGASGAVAYGQSAARAGEYVAEPSCENWIGYQRTDDPADDHNARFIGHTWYLGLIFTVALGAGGLWTAARRLRVPAAKLPRGVRVA